MMEYDKLVAKAGKAGMFQVTLFIAMGFVNMHTNLENLAVNFLSPVHAHRCLVPGLEHLPQDEVKRLALPPGDSHHSYDSCFMYDVTWNVSTSSENITLREINTTETISCEYGYVFEQGVFETTATSQFELVCDKEGLLDLISPVYNVGFLFGALGAGIVSDRFGRLAALLLFSVLHFLGGVGVFLSPNVWMYMISRMIIAASVRATCNTGGVLLMESVSAKHRIRAVVGYQLFFAFGGVVLVGLAYFIRHFQWLQLAIIIPLIPMISYKWIFPESPRWLLMKGRIQEAADAVQWIAARNRRAIPPEDVHQFIKSTESDQANPAADKAKQQQVGFKVLFTHPVIRRYLLALVFMLVSSQFIYLGISMNIDQLFGNVYVNVLVSVLVDFPANLALWFFLERLGRKPSFTGAQAGIVLCCALSVVFMYVPGLEMGVTILSILIRSLGTCCLCTVTCYIGEVFPTSIRQMALGISAGTAAIVSIAAPLVGGPLKAVWEPLPSTIFGVMGLAAVALCQTLPETLGANLPDTIEDVCQLGRQRISSSSEPNKSRDCEEAARDCEEAAVNIKVPIPDSVVCPIDIDMHKPSLDKEHGALPTKTIIDQLQASHSFAYYGPELFNTHL